jgi:hypothetical protein
MDMQAFNDLRDFHRFVGEKVNHGGVSLSPEDVLDEWRNLHPAPQVVDDDTAAIQEAIDDMESGDRGISFEDFDREFRARHKLPHP